MKTYKEFISELTQADLNAETSRINKISQQLKTTTPVNKPNFGSQTEPQKPKNAINSERWRYVGRGV
jgi:hypothetical protein